MSTTNSFLSPAEEVFDGGGTGDTTAMKDSMSTSMDVDRGLDIIPLGKYKRTPSIPIDMLEQNRSSPSVIELDILRRKRQQEAQLEMLHCRDLFTNETLVPRDSTADSHYIHRVGPILRFQQSPPALNPFARKSFKSGMLLPMRRNLLSPPKILVGQPIGRSDDRLSEMMTTNPDSDDFLLRFPMTAEENSNLYVDLDCKDIDNFYYTDDMDRHGYTRKESQDDLFIPSSTSTGLEGVHIEILRCRSTSPVRETITTKSKITLKPKLRNKMNASPYPSQEDLLPSQRHRGSPPTLSTLNISNETPIKPRVRHPQYYSDVSSDLTLNTFNIETSSKDVVKPAYFVNEASPFRLVTDKTSLHAHRAGLFHSSIDPSPSLSHQNTPSNLNTPFYSYDCASGDVNTLKALGGVESTWTLDANNRSSIECSDFKATHASLDPERFSDLKMSCEVTPATRTMTSRNAPIYGILSSQPNYENDNTPI